MSPFTVLSDGRILAVATFEAVTALAAQERHAGHRVAIHRATPAERAVSARQRPRGWAVQVSVAGASERLDCLDEEDATRVRHELTAYGVHAAIVRA